MNIFRSTSSLYVTNKTGEIKYEMKDKSKEIKNIILLDPTGSIVDSFECRVVEKYEVRRQTLWVVNDIKTKKVLKDSMEPFLMKSNNNDGGYDLYLPFTKWEFVCYYSRYRNSRVHETPVSELYKIIINDIELHVTKYKGYVGEDLTKEYNETFNKIKENNSKIVFETIEKCIEYTNENLELLEKCKGILEDSKDMYGDMIDEFIVNFEKNGRLE